MYIIFIILIILLLFIFITYNSLIKLRNRVNEAFSTMDVYLKKRWDLIPNIVETVKGYAKHEQNTLEEVVKLRNNIYDNLDNDNKIDVNYKLSNDISKLMLLVESYPELKASDSFKDLSNQLVKAEEDIANSRKYYNATVRLFNNKVEMFPSNIIANILGFKVAKMFEVNNNNERENVNLNL